MANTTTLCSHENEIIDQQQGDIICYDCGIIIDSVYLQPPCTTQIICDDKIKTYILDILDRLHFPKKFCDLIRFECSKHEKKLKRISEEKEKIMTSYYIYEVLNKEGIPITLKDISDVTGYSTQQLFCFQNTPINPLYDQLLDKACSMLHIDYKLNSVIKKKLPNKMLTGHNPATVVGATIYSHFKEERAKNSLKIKDISTVLKISPVSIQRYMKKK